MRRLVPTLYPHGLAHMVLAISYLGIAGCIEQHVLGLHITVEEGLQVHTLECREDTGGVELGIRLGR